MIRLAVQVRSDQQEILDFKKSLEYTDFMFEIVFVILLILFIYSFYWNLVNLFTWLLKMVGYKTKEEKDREELEQWLDNATNKIINDIRESYKLYGIEYGEEPKYKAPEYKL